MSRRALGLLLALAAPMVLAQEEAPPPAASESDSGPPAATIPVPQEDDGTPEPSGTATQLDDITVTASKRVASPRTLASSVSVLGGEQMEDLGLRDVADIVKQIPGVNIWDLQNGTTPQKITVRGISSDLGTAATTGVFLDETPFTDATVAVSVLDMNPFDLSSVEVLKGPVGTLFGGSALNGAIRYIPQAPKPGEWELKSFGEVSTTKNGGLSDSYGAALNVPLFDRDDLALRLAGVQRHSSGVMDSVNDSYTKRDINSTDQTSLRGLLGWQALDRLQLTGMIVTQETEVDDVLRFTERSDSTTERSATAQPSPSVNEYQVYNLKGTWAFDWADLVFNVAQLDKRGALLADFSYLAQRSNPPRSAAVTLDYDGTSMVQEVRFVSTDDGGDFDWIVGIFNYDYDVLSEAGLITNNGAITPAGPAFGPLLNALPPTSGVIFNQDNQIDAVHVESRARIAEQAAFGEVDWRFFEGLQLSAGLRAYRFTYDIDNTTRGAGCVLADPTCPATFFVARANPTADEPGLNPRLSLKWQAGRDLMFYMTAARGYRFGGINLIPDPASPRTFKSDSLLNYETGVRTEWLERTLITDLTLFGIDWTDAQVSLISPNLPVAYVDNVGKVNGSGAEAQLIWLTPLPGVRLTVIPAYADIRTAAPFQSGSTTLPPGMQWPLSPRFSASGTLSGNLTLLERALLDASVTYRYMSEAPQQLSNTMQKVFGYSTWDFGLTLKSLAPTYWPELSINVNNITNERGVNFVTGYPPLENLTAYIEPRRATARLTFHF